MSKNLCPENDISFENSQTIRFETNIPAGTYTASAIVKSTDTDSSVCLMLFYYADGATKEVYIGRSVDQERVSKSFDLAQDAAKVRIYASEGYNPSVGDTAIFNKLMIEAGSEMTDYVPYGDEPEPEENIENEAEVCLYFAALAGAIPKALLPRPTCRVTHLIRKLLMPDYEIPFANTLNFVEAYLWDLIGNSATMLKHTPTSDMEKYLHVAIGGTVEGMPNPYKCELNYWMDEWLTNQNGK